MKHFTCNKEDKSRVRLPSKAPPKFTKKRIRIECTAHMKINIYCKRVYTVTSFDSNHNHATSIATKVRMLKSHKRISNVQKTMTALADAAGIKPKATYDLLAKQAGVRCNLTFIPDDSKNYLRTKIESAIALGDAGALMQCLQDRQNEDLSFYYVI